MADFRTTSSEHLAARGVAVGKGASSSAMTGSGPWDAAGSLDQIRVVRIDDSHIAEGQADGKDVVGYYEMEYSLPAEDENEGEEMDDGVYVIEYSNPEEEGESYQFTMSLDRSQPVRKPPVRHPAVDEHATVALMPSRPIKQKQKRMLVTEEEEVNKEAVLSLGSNQMPALSVPALSVPALSVPALSVPAPGEDYGGVMMSNKEPLMCGLCPPPGRFFKRASGLAVHLKQMHQFIAKKTFFCPSCQQTVRTQQELDTHTRRHANQVAVFTCFLCSDKAAGYAGSRIGLKRHLEAEHPGVVPRCNVCNKGFKTLVSYLSDQFRHVGVSPYYCPRCQIYEMTERGLSVHLKNHDKRQKLLEVEKKQLAHVNASADNSATDDSDF